MVTTQSLYHASQPSSESNGLSGEKMVHTGVGYWVSIFTLYFYLNLGHLLVINVASSGMKHLDA